MSISAIFFSFFAFFAAPLHARALWSLVLCALAVIVLCVWCVVALPLPSLPPSTSWLATVLMWLSVAKSYAVAFAALVCLQFCVFAAKDIVKSACDAVYAMARDAWNQHCSVLVSSTESSSSAASASSPSWLSTATVLLWLAVPVVVSLTCAAHVALIFFPAGVILAYASECASSRVAARLYERAKTPMINAFFRGVAMLMALAGGVWSCVSRAVAAVRLLLLLFTTVLVKPSERVQQPAAPPTTYHPSTHPPLSPPTTPTTTPTTPTTTPTTPTMLTTVRKYVIRIVCSIVLHVVSKSRIVCTLIMRTLTMPLTLMRWIVHPLRRGMTCVRSRFTTTTTSNNSINGDKRDMSAICGHSISISIDVDTDKNMNMNMNMKMKSDIDVDIDRIDTSQRVHVESRAYDDIGGAYTSANTNSTYNTPPFIAITIIDDDDEDDDDDVSVSVSVGADNDKSPRPSSSLASPWTAIKRWSPIVACGAGAATWWRSSASGSVGDCDRGSHSDTASDTDTDADADADSESYNYNYYNYDSYDKYKCKYKYNQDACEQA